MSEAREIDADCGSARCVVGAVAVFDLDDPLVDLALAFGARAVVSKKYNASQLTDILVRMDGGDAVVELIEGSASTSSGEADADWRGCAEGLTRREREVLMFVANGLSNREIADALYIGEQTVKSHLRKIFAKLGVKNRTHAARFAGAHRSPV